MDRLDFHPSCRPTSALERRTSRRRIGAMAALGVLVAGGLVATVLWVSNAGQAGYGVAAHPAEALVLGGHGPSLERGGGWQRLTPLY